MARFRWNDWNVAHIAKHGVTPAEAEAVVEQHHATTEGQDSGDIAKALLEDEHGGTGGGNARV